MIKYLDVRSSMKSGDIIAISHTGWRTRRDIESEIVRMATRSEFSHVGMLWLTGGRVFVLEAVTPTVTVSPLSKYKDFFWLAMNKPLSDTALKTGLSHVGERYSRLEAIWGFFGCNLKDNKKWECAEYVKVILDANGVCIPGTDTPSNVVRWCMERFNCAIVEVQNA